VNIPLCPLRTRNVIDFGPSKEKRDALITPVNKARRFTYFPGGKRGALLTATSRDRTKAHLLTTDHWHWQLPRSSLLALALALPSSE
jgi:hypothetical protein